MCDGIIIEGHILLEIRHDLANESGILYEILCWVSNNCGIAMTPHIEADWQNRLKEGDVFLEWYREQIESKRVHIIPLKSLNSHIVSKIHNYYRLPRQTFILHYIRCAHSTDEPKYILANEMDLHQPTAKSLAPKTQNDIRNNRSGLLCRFLQEKLHIRVGNPDDFKRHFSIDCDICTDKVSGNPCSFVTA